MPVLGHCMPLTIAYKSAQMIIRLECQKYWINWDSNWNRVFSIQGLCCSQEDLKQKSGLKCNRLSEAQTTSCKTALTTTMSARMTMSATTTMSSTTTSSATVATKIDNNFSNNTLFGYNNSNIENVYNNNFVGCNNSNIDNVSSNDFVSYSNKSNNSNCSNNSNNSNCSNSRTTESF